MYGIDYRWGASNFDPERMRKGAVELVALAPDVVLATTVPIVLALQQVSRTVPIVFGTDYRRSIIAVLMRRSAA